MAYSIFNSYLHTYIPMMQTTSSIDSVLRYAILRILILTQEPKIKSCCNKIKAINNFNVIYVMHTRLIYVEEQKNHLLMRNLIGCRGSQFGPNRYFSVAAIHFKIARDLN